MLSLVHSLSTFNILAVASAGRCLQGRHNADSKDLDLPIMGRACGTRNTTLGLPSTVCSGPQQPGVGESRSVWQQAR